jgi:hypothetical protein
MTHMHRLRDGDHYAACLLRAGLRDRPPREAKQAAATALGLLAGSGTALVMKTATATAVVAGAPSKATATVGIWAVSKWIAIGVLSGAAVSGGTVAVTALRSDSEAARTPVPAAAPGAGRSGAVLSARHEPGRVDPSVSPTEQTPATPVRSAFSDAPALGPSGAAPAAARFPEAPASPSLAEEIRLLDQAKRELARGHGALAVAQLDAARGRIHVLCAEAELLRVQALVVTGQRAEAEQLARHMRQLYPGSPHVQRLGALLGEP